MLCVTSRAFQLAVIFALFAQPGTAQEAPLKKACKDLYFGPYAYSRIRETPIDLKFEACFDGTAWTEVFNFKTTLLGNLNQLQKLVDELINSQIQVCHPNSTYAVVVGKPTINSLPPEHNTQRVNIRADANVRLCRFSRLVSADLVVEIPVVIDLKTLHLRMGEPITLASSGGALDTVSRFVPGMKRFINEKARNTIQPYVDKVTEFQKDNEAQLRFLKPSAREITLVTSNDTLSLQVKMETKLTKEIMGAEAKTWLASQGVH